MAVHGGDQLGRVWVRDADLKDYDAVMALNRNVYDGSDYLPVMYRSFLQDKRFHGFVAETDAGVVGFKGYFCEGNDEMVTVGSRVHVKHSGKYVFVELAKQSLNLMQLRFPEVRRSIWCAYDSDFYKDPVKMARNRYSLIETWNCMEYLKPYDVYKNLTTSTKLPQVANIIEPNNSDVLAILDTELNREVFFPTGYLLGFYIWVPRKVNTKSLRELVANHRVLLSMATSTKCEAVSWLVSYKASLGTSALFHFARRSCDENTLVAHLVCQVRHLLDSVQPSTNISLEVNVPRDMDMDKVRRMLRPVLGKDNKSAAEVGVMASQTLGKPSRL